MADVCWMTAQLLASCMNNAISQTPALDRVADIFVQAGMGNSTLPLAPSANSLAPDFSATLCQVPQMQPRRMLDSLGTDSTEDTYGLELGPALESVGSPPILSEPQGAIAPAPSAPPPLVAQPEVEVHTEPPQFSGAVAAFRSLSASDAFFASMRPRTGSQLYSQRRAALRAGKLYTRISPNEFADQWKMATAQPTYQQWQDLLAQEARSIATGQGNNQLTIIVGDSLSLWIPPEWLSRDRFWLNQSISGETSAQILQRLPTFAATRPDTIHVMAGVNDIKQGASDEAVITNLQLIMRRLHQQHPQARIVMYSILPTRLPRIPSDRIRQVNQQIAVVAARQGVDYVDLQPEFTDAQGNLDRDLTTDGVHLNPQGYQVWHAALSGI